MTVNKITDEVVIAPGFKRIKRGWGGNVGNDGGILPDRIVFLGR